MSDVRSKIVKLLRLAIDREGTPEGDTAQKIANELIALHGVDVSVDDAAYDEPIVQHLVAETPKRVWWMEMLLVTLCDFYEAETVTLVFGDGYRLYVVCEDANELQRHFEYLCDLIEDLRDSSAPEFMRAPTKQRDDAVTSFCIGAVHRVSQLLYHYERDEWIDLERMPFMLRAITGEVDRASSSNVQIAPFEIRERGDTAEVVPEWQWFDVGYRNATRDILEVFPSVEDEDLAI